MGNLFLGWGGGEEKVLFPQNLRESSFCDWVLNTVQEDKWSVKDCLTFALNFSCVYIWVYVIVNTLKPIWKLISSEQVNR